MIYDLLQELKNKLAFTRCCYIGVSTDDVFTLFNHNVNIIDSSQRILTLTIECGV